MKARTSERLLQENTLALGVSLTALAVYLTTVCPTVSFIDNGELASVAVVLGIAHPTGYPLFSLLGRCAVLVPLANEEILQLNIFGAVITAISAGIFFKVVLALKGAFLANEEATRAGQRGNKKIRLLSAAIAALVFGFSETVWSQSVAVEVYGLHLVLLLLAMLVFLKGIRERDTPGGRIPQHLLLSSYLLGLGFANHLTMILIVPAVGFLYFKAYGTGKEALRRCARIVPFFLLGISCYLYLPIRSSVHPPLDWGHPAELQRLLWHVTGKQYRSWIFSSFESAEGQLKYFIHHFPAEFNWLVLIVAAVGVLIARRRHNTIFWFLAIAFLTCLLYSVNYDIHDINSYFLLCYVAVALFVSFGLEGALDSVGAGKNPTGGKIALLLAAVLPIVQIWSNRGSVGEADNYLVEDYTQNIFRNLEPNAFVLSYQWDYFVAPAIYYQIVRGQRKDVSIVDKELLRRSWYFVDLGRRYPWLIDSSRGKVDRFLRELHKFEHDMPYDPRIIEARYVEMINDFIDKARSRGPVYVGPEIEPEFGATHQRIPRGLLFRLVGTHEGTMETVPKIDYRPTEFEDRLTRGVRRLSAQMLALTARRLRERGDSAGALHLAQKAVLFQPGYTPARNLLQELQK